MSDDSHSRRSFLNFETIFHIPELDMYIVMTLLNHTWTSPRQQMLMLLQLPYIQ